MLFENRFQSGKKISSVFLPLPTTQIFQAWSELQKIMVKKQPHEFTRSEWAYLISFLQRENLQEFFQTHFGSEITSNSQGGPHQIFKARGHISIWLPSNVSLLGPLNVIALSLTGNQVTVKTSSSGKDLTSLFIEYVIQNSTDRSFAEQIKKSFSVAAFSHGDSRQNDFSLKADVRLFYGSDAAAEAVKKLPVKSTALDFMFVDKVSEAWLNWNCSDAELESLADVFFLYGREGCTSPLRVIVIDADAERSKQFCQRLVNICNQKFHQPVQTHLASSHLFSTQSGQIEGWSIYPGKENNFVVGLGTYQLQWPIKGYVLPVIPSSLSHALKELPKNIQTIGLALDQQQKSQLLQSISSVQAKRLVPLAQMHHYAMSWDGFEYWRNCFESMETNLNF